MVFPPTLHIGLIYIGMACIGVSQGGDQSVGFEDSVGAEWVAETGALLNDGAACGIYSMAAALSAFGVEVTPRDYFTNEYVAAEIGSSGRQLCRMAAENGIRGVAVENLNLAGLRCFTHPVLLNMKGGDFEGQLTGYWVVFLGIAKNGDYRIFDPFSNAKLLEVSGDALNANWHGDALILVPEATSPVFVIAKAAVASLVPFASLLMMGVFCGWLLHRAVRKMPGQGWAAILTTVSLMTLAAFAFDSAGPKDALVRDWVKARHDWSEAAPIDYFRFVDRLKNDSELVVVDARTRAQFQELHLAGSVNAPAMASIWEFVDAIKPISHDRPVVVLCASEHCRWDEIVANRLIQSGFEDVRVFQGGIAQCFQSPSFVRNNGILLVRK